MKNPTLALSYLIVTKNKLPYLRRGLEKVIAQKAPDEEILVADGGSTDGTKEYLAELKAAGKIDYFISEKDSGLAHGLNKLALVAHGTLLKYLTDDDAFDYEVIRACKAFMLEHPAIDLVNTEGGSLNDPTRALAQKDPLEGVRSLDYATAYDVWREAHTPFFFCDLGVMFRRSSIPVVGLWDTAFPGPDIEFSLRVSGGRVNIAWYTGYSWVNISNPQSVSLVYMKKTKLLTERLRTFYFDQGPESFIVQKFGVLKNKLMNVRKKSRSAGSAAPASFEASWPRLCDISEKWMSVKNAAAHPEFIWKK